jgi:hypothetical protein
MTTSIGTSERDERRKLLYAEKLNLDIMIQKASHAPLRHATDGEATRELENLERRVEDLWQKIIRLDVE